MHITGTVSFAAKQLINSTNYRLGSIALSKAERSKEQHIRVEHAKVALAYLSKAIELTPSFKYDENLVNEIL
jgi:hypothetical protein